MSPAPASFGFTWWGQRWIAALEALGAVYANRLPRGRTYARAGRVTDLAVEPGAVTARVRGSRARPYRVALGLPVFGDGTWERVLAALAGELRHAAALLDGRMPEDVDAVVAGCGVSLFPGPRELATSCSCPDDANPCKHVAAVHYVLAQRFDADPFLLPALRGRDRAALLGGLRAARAGGVEVAVDADDALAPLPLSELVARDLLQARGDLAAVRLRPHPPADTGSALARLGAPPGAAEVADELDALAAGAADMAWRLLTADPDHNAEHAVVAEVRQRGPSTAADLAAALDVPLPQIRSELRTLVAQGALIRTGHARSTRYQT